MSGASTIQYLTHREIDKAKWDRCMENAPNGLIYAYSFYLDHMARNWDAIVLGDYDTVMPLPWNSKYGIRYIYQPFLTAQLGVFGKNLTPELVTGMIHAIPSSFRLIEVSLNTANQFDLPKKDWFTRSNYILSLDKDYARLELGYNDNTGRNIKKAMQAGCIARKDIDAEEVIGLAIAQMQSYDNQSKENVDRFRKLYSSLYEKKMAISYGISINDVLLSGAIFFFSHKRAYYILVGNHPEGRSLGTSHALIDSFIKDHAGKEMILDFEGSDIRSLAAFYSGFGATHESYPALKVHRLPIFLRWMKK